MIERRGTTARASQIVKHNGVAYLSSQVAEGDSIQDQTRDCLAKVHDLLSKLVVAASRCYAPQSGFQICLILWD